MSRSERKQSGWQSFVLPILLLILIIAVFLYYKGTFQTDSALHRNMSDNQKRDTEEQKDGDEHKKSILMEDGTLKEIGRASCRERV